MRVCCSSRPEYGGLISDDLEKLILKAMTAHSEEDFSRAIRYPTRVDLEFNREADAPI